MTDEITTNQTLFDRFQGQRDSNPLFYYSLILGILSLLAGLIFGMVNRIASQAFFYDIAIILLAMSIIGYTMTEHFQSLIKPGVDWFTKQYQQWKILILIAIFLIILLISYGLALITPINFLSQSYLAIILAGDLIFVSVGLTMIIRVRKFANFAHSELVIVGVYAGITFNEIMGSQGGEWYTMIFVELIVAFMGAGVVGLLSEIFVFGPLTRRNATPLSLMVASIGLGMIIRQSIQEYHGAVPRTFSPVFPNFFDNLTNIPVLNIFFQEITLLKLPGGVNLSLNRTDLWGFLIMILTIATLQYIFTNTTIGISMRATADDPELAQITGINTQRVIYFTWFISSGVTGMGALFLFKSAQIQPGSGFIQLLLIFAVVILGGFDSFKGTVVSGFIISFTMTGAIIFNSKMGERQKESELIDKMVFWSTSGDWKLVIAFAIIIVVLIFRPRGIFGLVDPKSKL